MSTIREGSPHVLIAGAGIVGLETALALRAVAGNAVRISLVSPEKDFRLRLLAPLDVLGAEPPETYELQAICDDLEVDLHSTTLETVAATAKCVRLGDGRTHSYDWLVLGLGARAHSSVTGVPIFRDSRDEALVRRLMLDLLSGRATRAAFVVPSGCSWPLPLYEVALLIAARVQDARVPAALSLITPERRPLELFGSRASALVAALLAERGIRFVGDSAAVSMDRGGRLQLGSQGALGVDRALSVPQLRGQRIPGVPASWWGFIPTDASGRVQGVSGIFAAGDITSSPIKQGGLAAQQADRIAETIALEAGLPVGSSRHRSVLQARLLGGSRPLFLRVELDRWHKPTSASLQRLEPGSGAHPEEPRKLMARYLAPYLERRSGHAPAAV